jgi:hypothetical protein
LHGTTSAPSGGSEPAPGARLGLHCPLGTTLVLALAILAAIGFLAEAVVQSPAVRPRLPAGSYGTSSRYLDYHLDHLREFSRREGGVDCIFIGASPVFRGIDPAIVAEAYRARTGQSIRCFNFGIRGMDPVNAAILARIIKEDYHPQWLIFGLDVANLAAGPSEGLRMRILTSRWIAYRQGRFDLEGWVVDHSSAFRLYLQYRDWMKPPFSAQALVEADRAFAREVGPDGHTPLLKTATDLDDRPGTGTDEARYFELLGAFTLDPAQLSGMEGLLQREPGQQTVLLEMPVHPTYLHYYGRGEADYRLGLAAAEQAAANAGAPFWTTTREDLIPEEGWTNRIHLNALGARVFSEWLGTQLGNAVLEGTLTDPSTLRSLEPAQP